MLAAPNYRLICTEECRCETGERSLPARLRDLSGEGAFVRTVEPFPVGEPIRLHFKLQERPVEVTAVVRHSEGGYGMGIQFVIVQPRDREVLHRFLTSQLDRLGAGAYSRVRKAPRVSQLIPVRVQGRNAMGEPFSEDTKTVDVSDIGARVLLQNRVVRGEMLALVANAVRGPLWVQCRTAWQGALGRDLEQHVGLELSFVDLWGIHELAPGQD